MTDSRLAIMTRCVGSIQHPRQNFIEMASATADVLEMVHDGLLIEVDGSVPELRAFRATFKGLAAFHISAVPLRPVVANDRCATCSGAAAVYELVTIGAHIIPTFEVIDCAVCNGTGTRS